MSALEGVLAPVTDERLEPPSDSDEALMLAHARGDRLSFARLFRRYAPRLVSFFRRRARGSPAEDLVQLTFMRLHSARDSYRPDLPLRPFLYAIAIRVQVDDHRRRARSPALVALDGLSERVDASGGDPETRALAGELAARAQRAIDALPETQRMVVLLHRFEELGFAEIAQTLTLVEGAPLTEGAARIRAFRAYESLRRALEVNEGGTK